MQREIVHMEELTLPRRIHQSLEKDCNEVTS